MSEPSVAEMLLSSPFGVMLGLILIFGLSMAASKLYERMTTRRRIRRRLRMH